VSLRGSVSDVVGSCDDGDDDDIMIIYFKWRRLKSVRLWMESCSIKSTFSLEPIMVVIEPTMAAGVVLSVTMN